MIRFAQITDLHLDVDLACDPAPERLRQVLGELGALPERPDAILFSGDLIDRGDVASYEVLLRIAQDAPAPVIYAMGNHDDPAAFRSALGQEGDPATFDHDEVIAGQHIITLDSSRRGQTQGDLSPAQIEWLEDCLAAHAGLPKWIMLHHPPAIDSQAPFTWASLTGDATARLGKVLARHRVEAICTGHIHCDRVLHWQGAPVVISRGLSSRFDWRAPREQLSLYQDPGFALITRTDGAVQAAFHSLQGCPPDKTIPYEVLAGF